MHRERWVILDKDPERRFNSEWASPLAPIMELVDMPASEAGADWRCRFESCSEHFFRPEVGRRERALDEYFVLTAFGLYAMVIHARREMPT